MTAMMSVGIVLLAAAFFGLFYFRRRYMRLYEAVQQFQKQILEGQAVWPGPDTEAAEDVIRDAFLRIQKKYDREAESLQRDREAVQGLISDLSHQLKTPLANIRLYQDLLKNREISLKQREKLEQRLEEQTDKLEWLLEALFRMVDLERGQGNLEAEPADAAETVKRALAQVRPRADAKHIRIGQEPSDGLLLLHDPKWTEEVFFNLLDNAVKYSPEGSVIRISYDKFETYGAVHIRDAAPCVPPEEYPCIFQKFYRGKNAGEQEGWGVGLYLARLILEQEQGYVKVDAVPGGGNIFSVFLPVSF